MTDYFPLYYFFQQLKKFAEYKLGIEEYLDLLNILKDNPQYLEDFDKLYLICKTLWLKPNFSQIVFRNLFISSFDNVRYLAFEKELKNIVPVNESEESQTTSEENATITENNAEDIKVTETEQNKTTEDSEEDKENMKKDGDEEFEKEDDNNSGDETEEEENKPLTEQIDDFKQLYLSIKKGSGKADTRDFNQENILTSTKFLFHENFFPFTARQMEQNWNFLQNKMITGTSENINMVATVDKIARHIHITQPVFYERIENKFNLLCLIDNKGAMLAFEELADVIINQSLANTTIHYDKYFFERLPEEHLYLSKVHSGFIKIQDVFKKYLQLKNVGILIISDAGAASYSFNTKRIDATFKLIESLRKISVRIAWLNPIPEDRWEHTSAHYISEFVSMFYANEKGLMKAVNVFRGKLKPQKIVR